MEKRNSVEPGVTPCAHCPKKSVAIDVDGAVKCKKHMGQSGVTTKEAAVRELPNLHKPR